jgi:threonine dehydrogenase-like Zn-dependent dehydrogenase
MQTVGHEPVCLCVDRHTSDPVGEVMRMTDGVGAFACCEMSGAPAALEQALRCVMPTGTIAGWLVVGGVRVGGTCGFSLPAGIVSVLGLYTKPVTLDVSKLIVARDVTLRGACACAKCACACA